MPQSQLIPSLLKSPPTSHDCRHGQLYGAGGADNKERKKERKGRGREKREKGERRKEERKKRRKINYNCSVHSTVQRILSRNLLDRDNRRAIGHQTGKRSMVAPKHGARGCQFFDESGRVRDCYRTSNYLD